MRAQISRFHSRFTRLANLDKNKNIRQQFTMLHDEITPILEQHSAETRHSFEDSCSLLAGYQYAAGCKMESARDNPKSQQGYANQQSIFETANSHLVRAQTILTSLNSPALSPHQQQRLATEQAEINRLLKNLHKSWADTAWNAANNLEASSDDPEKLPRDLHKLVSQLLKISLNQYTDSLELTPAEDKAGIEAEIIQVKKKLTDIHHNNGDMLWDQAVQLDSQQPKPLDRIIKILKRSERRYQSALNQASAEEKAGLHADIADVKGMIRQITEERATAQQEIERVAALAAEQQRKQQEDARLAAEQQRKQQEATRLAALAAEQQRKQQEATRLAALAAEHAALTAKQPSLSAPEKPRRNVLSIDEYFAQKDSEQKRKQQQQEAALAAKQAALAAKKQQTTAAVTTSDPNGTGNRISTMLRIKARAFSSTSRDPRHRGHKQPAAAAAAALPTQKKASEKRKRQTANPRPEASLPVDVPTCDRPLFTGLARINALIGPADCHLLIARFIRMHTREVISNAVPGSTIRSHGPELESEYFYQSSIMNGSTDAHREYAREVCSEPYYLHKYHTQHTKNSAMNAFMRSVAPTKKSTMLYNKARKAGIDSQLFKIFKPNVRALENDLKSHIIQQGFQPQVLSRSLQDFLVSTITTVSLGGGIRLNEAQMQAARTALLTSLTEYIQRSKQYSAAEEAQHDANAGTQRTRMRTKSS